MTEPNSTAAQINLRRAHLKSLVLLLTIVITLVFCSMLAAQQGSDMLPDAIIYPGEKPGHILVVDKADQLLYLYKHEKGSVFLEKVMSCSTGANKGDKIVEGDKKTPNGYYIFNQKLLPRELSPIYGTLAYPTDYPNFWDKRLGRGGYGIWTHGINKPLVDYDSNGCVELENADVANLEDLIRLFDTPMLVYEELTQKSSTELEKEAQDVRAFISDWRKSWVQKDLNAYKSKYDPQFVNSDNRSLQEWMRHKANLASKYKTIKVDIKDLRIYRHRDVIVAVFEQDYRGDSNFSSIGLKRLYIKKIGNSYKIVGEEFQNMPKRETNKWLTAEEKKLAIETPPLTLAQAEATGAAGLDPEKDRAAVEAVAAIGRKDDKVAEEEALPSAEAEAKLKEAKAKAEAEAKLKEAKAKAEAEAKLKEAKAKAEAEAKLKEAKAKAEAEAKLKEAKAKAEAELSETLRSWARAWSNRDTSSYFKFYHDDFKFAEKNLDLKGFKKYRTKNISKAKMIEVKISNIKININGNKAKVSFKQKYRSDGLVDTGRKTMTLKKSGGKWKITSEKWQLQSN